MSKKRFSEGGRVPDMASETVPEPLTNQEVTAEQEANFPASGRRGPELVQSGGPPIPADRELPRAPRQEEWKSAVQEKAEELKRAASRAKETAAQAMQDAKEQASAAVSHAQDRAADIYRESRIKTRVAVDRTRSRINHLVIEYPIQVIAGVAAVAFVAGVLLRVWRSSRDA
jgi:ElaB/YqjD/DUF883 family membrane-anchored ribosome-binding protein